MKRLTLPNSWCCVAAMAAMLGICSPPHARAQAETPPPQGVSRGENFSAKPPAQLFASDCTGAGCHKGPQGLNKGQGFGSLAGFLREHYTNSRESAAALASYLAKLPSGPEPREARTPRSGKPAAAASTGPREGFLPSFGETAPAGKPEPKEAHTPRQTGRTSRAAVKPEEEPLAASHRASGEPGEAAPKPTRNQRGRQPAAATAAVVAPPLPPPAAAPEAEPPAAPAAAASPPPAPAAPPAPKDYDIFD